VGVLGKRVVAIRQATDATEYCALHGGTEGLEDELRDYFQLGTPLAPLYAAWGRAGCSRMKIISERLPGLRILRQDPVECLFSFITSSNNNVPRITLILDRIRERYGEFLCAKTERAEQPNTVAPSDPATTADDGASVQPAMSPSPARNKLMPRMEISSSWHSFPSVERLAQVSEEEFRQIGLGYRAKFIRNSAIKIVAAAAREGHTDGSAYLKALRSRSREEVMAALLELDGVGPKVGDCVALFSLDQISAVPVDTHVWRIACRDYDPSLAECKSLTPSVYSRVGALFRDRFGEHAGWGHQLLFAAELQEFRAILPAEMIYQMEEARSLEKMSKAKEKEEKEARRLPDGSIRPATPKSGRSSAAVSPASASVTPSEKNSKSKPKAKRSRATPSSDGPDGKLTTSNHKRRRLPSNLLDDE